MLYDMIDHCKISCSHRVFTNVTRVEYTIIDHQAWLN